MQTSQCVFAVLRPTVPAERASRTNSAHRYLVGLDPREQQELRNVPLLSSDLERLRLLATRADVGSEAKHRHHRAHLVIAILSRPILCAAWRAGRLTTMPARGLLTSMGNAGKCDTWWTSLAKMSTKGKHRRKVRWSKVLQLVLALGIFPTTYFAWQSWQEARATRENQERQFLAENAPRIVINKAYVSEGQVMIEVANEGGSDARKIGVGKGVIRPDGSDVFDWELMPHQVDTLRKGEMVRLHVTDLSTTTGILSYSPSVLELKRNAKPDGTLGVVQVAVIYQDFYKGFWRAEAAFIAKP